MSCIASANDRRVASRAMHSHICKHSHTRCTYMFCIKDSVTPPMSRNAGLSLLEVNPRKKIQIASASMAMNAECFSICGRFGSRMVLGRVPRVLETDVLLVLDARGSGSSGVLGCCSAGIEAQSRRRYSHQSVQRLAVAGRPRGRSVTVRCCQFWSALRARWLQPLGDTES